MLSIVYDEGTFEFNQEEASKLEELRKLVEDSPELEIGIDDTFLSRWLYFAQWNVKEAFASINRYYDFKAENPQWFGNLENIEQLRDLFVNIRPRFVLKKRDAEGRVIIIQKLVDAFDKYPNYFFDLVYMDDYIFEAILATANGQKFGVSIINDFQGFNKNFMKVLTPSNMTAINGKGEILPFVSNQMHIIKKGVIVGTALSLIMKFMSKEVKAKMTIHDGKNYDKLTSILGFENVPKEYGGQDDYDALTWGGVVENSGEVLFEFIKSNWETIQKVQKYRKVIKT